jgi:small subunit ribosomal protein S4
MSRFTGPRVKVMRALGCELPGLSRKSLPADASRPGQHGRRPQRLSDFANKLREKQKIRFNYGLRESQLRKLMTEAKHAKDPTGDKLLELVERRLDNAVFRAGFAPTLPAARQLIRHRHVRLNGRGANIPSIRVNVGDVVTLTERGRRLGLVRETLAEPSLARPEWIAVDETELSARVTRLPQADEVPFPVEIAQVVEYYANRL